MAASDYTMRAERVVGGRMGLYRESTQSLFIASDDATTCRANTDVQTNCCHGNNAHNSVLHTSISSVKTVVVQGTLPAIFGM